MLVNCVAYQNGRKLADIPVEDISEYVCRPDCFVWVALYDPAPAELDQMAEEFGLHPLAVEDACKGHQRPKIEEYHDSLFAVLQTVDKAPPGSDSPLHVGEVAIFVGTNYILSVRLRTDKGFAEVRARTEREPELLSHGSGYVFYALLDTIVDRYFPIVDALESELETIEEQIFVRNTARSNIEALYALKQQLMVVKHAVDPLIEATGKLYGGRVPQVCTGMQAYFRDVYDHLTRIHASIEGIREMLDHRDPGQSRHDQPQRDRGDQEARRVGGADRRPDVHRRALRNEFQEHPGIRLDVRLLLLAADDVRGGRDPLRLVQDASAGSDRTAARPASMKMRSAIAPVVAGRRHRNHAPVRRRHRPRRLQRDVVDAEIAREHSLCARQRAGPRGAFAQHDVR